MKTIIMYLFLGILGLSNFLQAQVPSPAIQFPNKVLIIGGTAHLGNGEVIENSVIAFQDGEFTFVKKKSNRKITESNYDTVIKLTNEHIYPGFILPNNTLGITEVDALRASRDFDDIGAFNPNLRSGVAFNTESKIIYTVRSNGVLISQVTPRGGFISGKSSVMKLDGWNYTDAVITMEDGIHLNWPQKYKSHGPWHNPKPMTKEKNTSEKIEEITSYFKAAKAYCEGDNPETNLKYEGMRGVLEGKQILYVHCNMSKEMLEVIHFKKELDLEKVVIVGGYDAAFLANELNENNVAVILRNVHSLPIKPQDDPHLPYKLPGVLEKKGVLFCLDASGSMEAMNSRNLPFLAGEARGFGLEGEKAIQSITLNTAKILGIDDQYGSLSAGKKATLFISKGDALDMRTNQVVQAWIDGSPIDLNNTQKELFQKYSKKYQSQP